MSRTEYKFSKVEDRYAVCGEILKSVKNCKNIQKMKHVKKYIIVYTIFNEHGTLICQGNATENWKLMKDKINDVKVGKIAVVCEEEHWNN
ncbi:MAG: hypothetical protein A3E21_06660 [Sulfurimonas sp. RIFCSPHIGHO2_12_FULL_36_9]|uniref:hypothetical protein n=1 Tax=Sulfurimonas sp. RIFCSPLOWO2_12_36_12 TaxID=1802253 RepID=UPI0008C170E6|nr:hypothetical protein [Sulfurimonas sp. RIFCSPLOWO2_12_36_12]OHD99337.1 MAG: hypothetical protein A3E21_06660 [Sulfurimonas sp. RIFCSPHIGHO2_12_FULL_36_9]OHD99619.1 MAG: hypothetical protein A3J26_07845 [Sulfurimonas sp. RIFCSPLOWO2_02_FULL_36_28]OHE01384.1 MAG: hypothetical protein A2W82_05495 [Sulfurimonas sp. RIFCSPLOWO2_12_36_12]